MGPQEILKLITRREVRTERGRDARRCAPLLLVLMSTSVFVPQSQAQIDLGPVTVGAGLRTDFTHSEPTGAKATNQFSLDDIRLYVNGSVTENIKFMFNTDFDGASNKLEVLDAVAANEESINEMTGNYMGASILYYERCQWWLFVCGLALTIAGALTDVFTGWDSNPRSLR
jgi:hypothetical protein